MIKLLLLALTALGLGGGVWKAQNPDGTLDDLKAQSTNTLSRLQSGVDTVIGYPDRISNDSEGATLNTRIEALEQQIGNGDSVAQDASAAVQNQADELLAENADAEANVDDPAAPMSAMTAAVAELNTALQETRARTDAGNVRQDAIERRLDLLVRRIDEQTTDEDLSGLSTIVESVQQRLDGFQTELDSHQSSLDESMAGIAEQTSNLDLRLGTLLSGASTTSTDGETSTGDNTDPDALAALSTNIDERLSLIEERLATVNADSRRITELNEKLDEANAKLAELEAQDSVTNDSITELDSSVQALTTVGESLSIDTIQAQIREQLAAAQSQIDSSAEEDNTAQLQSLLETTRNRIQTLEQRVQDLPASSSEADDALQNQSALQAQIANLEQRLGELTDADPVLENTVADVKQQVEQLSSQGFVTQDELQAQAQTEPETIEYKIYFDRNSADITADASTVLNSFISQERNRTTGVSIFGFTDRAGSAAYNQQLALQRATNVRSYLIQNGLDFTKIKALSGLGEDAAAAVLPDESADAQQRVVVLYAAQP